MGGMKMAGKMDEEIDLGLAEELGVEYEPYKMSDDDIIEEVANQVSTEGFIDKNDICETDIQRIKYAYVIYTLDYAKNVKIVYDYFDELGIKLCGRFSEFKYINMDACIRRAKEMSLRLMNDN